VDDGGYAGRAYASLLAQVEATDAGGAIVCLPVMAHGDRQGALLLSLPTAPDESAVEQLGQLADIVGRALAVAMTLTDRYERIRRARSLTLAAEMQWQLLPARGYADERVAIAGQLEPAYTIAGDAFDWSLNGDVLWVAAADGNGRGVTATLATAVAITALRNARRAGASLGEQFVSTLLLEFDLAARQLRVIDAGSPQLIRLRAQRVQHIELEAQLPLGMFEETVYREQLEDLKDSDRFVIVSDGVHAARSGSGEEFGRWTLDRVIQGARLLGAQEAVRHVVRELRAHRSDSRLDDDAVVFWVDLDPSPPATTG